VFWRAIAILALAATGVFAGLYFTGRGGSGVAAPCGEQRIFGHIRTLDRKNGRYLMHFDPALFTTGITANTAAAQDGVIPKGSAMPDDNYTVDESHRTYLYYVSPSAHVAVLTDTSNVLGNPVSVAQLAELVHGEAPVKLFEPLESGVWIEVHVDTVCDVAQQFHP